MESISTDITDIISVVCFNSIPYIIWTFWTKLTKTLFARLTCYLAFVAVKVSLTYVVVTLQQPKIRIIDPDAVLSIPLVSMHSRDLTVVRILRAWNRFDRFETAFVTLWTDCALVFWPFKIFKPPKINQFHRFGINFQKFPKITCCSEYTRNTNFTDFALNAVFLRNWSSKRLFISPADMNYSIARTENIWWARMTFPTPF